MSTTKEGGEKEWPGFYSCDDLVPPLCDPELVVTTGLVETLPGLSVAYWRYTPSTVQNENLAPPIIVIQGGPGLAHNYVKPLRSLACGEDTGGDSGTTSLYREIIFYDQAGTGASREERPDYPDEIFRIEYYAETELPALIRHLELDKFHLLGTSWGTQVAFQFAVSHIKHENNGLQSLVLNAPIADNHLFVEYQWDLVGGSLGKLPLYLQKRLKNLGKTQDFDAPEYQHIYNNIMSSFNARLGVLVDCWMETANAGFFNGQHMERLAGPSDFFDDFHSTLGNWTVLPVLNKDEDIAKAFPPVQLNFGEFDFVHPRLVAETVSALGYAKVECNRVPRAGHSLLLDSPEFVYPKMRDFLRRVDQQGPLFRIDTNAVCPVYHDSSGQAQSPGNSHDSSVHVAWDLQSHNLFRSLIWIVTLFVAFCVGAWWGERKKWHRAQGGGYERLGESIG
eukprot:scaffold6378_cov176-Amphora_coffeaeformis.AAC.10